MGRNNQTTETLGMFLQKTANTFGEKLWEEIGDVAISLKAMNTDAKPLAPGSDAVRALKKPGLYYQNGTFGLQLVCVYGDGSWGYAGLAKDKDGDDIIDDKHTYDIKNVRAKRNYPIKDSAGNAVLDSEGKPVVIPMGFETTKAYVAS